MPKSSWLTVTDCRIRVSVVGTIVGFLRATLGRDWFARTSVSSDRASFSPTCSRGLLLWRRTIAGQKLRDGLSLGGVHGAFPTA